MMIAPIPSIAEGTILQHAALEGEAVPGDTASQTELAARFENAEGVPRSFDRARELYCLAARQQDAEAQFRLGWMYANGRGVTRDDGIAAVLFASAAEQGHDYAARMLRYMQPGAGTGIPSCPKVNEQALSSGAGQLEEEPAGVASQLGPEVVALVNRLAPAFGVDSKLAMAMISVESAFNPQAVSAKNAQGLMQLMPETAQRFGVRQIMDPADNVKGGLAYLRWLLAYFEGNVTYALAAYNAGERTVEKYRGVPPYAETLEYVRKIKKIYKKDKHPFDRLVTQPSLVLRGE